jgi:hypothetical protein
VKSEAPDAETKITQHIIQQSGWHRFLGVRCMPSSVIHYYHYYAGSQRLRIHYVSGAAYDYKGIPGEVYEKFQKASSKGKFLNQEIKGKYPFEKVDE